MYYAIPMLEATHQIGFLYHLSCLLWYTIICQKFQNILKNVTFYYTNEQISESEIWTPQTCINE